MNTGSSIFMWVGSTGLVILLGLPLLISPMGWARKLGWKIPEEADLANYLEGPLAESSYRSPSWATWPPVTLGSTE
jgi:hypothetical protein